MSFLAECLNSLFAEYDRRGIRYCVLRNYEDLPESNVGSDIDMLIQRDALEENHRCILKVVSSLNIDYVSIVKRQYLTRYTLFKVVGDEIFSLVLDFHRDEEWKGAVYLSGEDILKERQPFKMFFIPSAVHEALILWLSPFLSGGMIKDRYVSKVLSVAEEDAREFRKLVARAFGEGVAIRVAESIAAGDLVGTLPLRKKMQRLLYLHNLERRPFAFMMGVMRFYARELTLRLALGGKFLAVVGPDGTGKSTVINALSAYFVKLFKTKAENIRIFHFRPGIFPNIRVLLSLGRSREAEENFFRPHRAKPSGPIISFIRLTYYYLDYLVGYFVKVRPLLVRNNIVIFDRYYYDFIVDPLRARINLPRVVSLSFLKIIPAPTLVVYLDNAPGLIYSRKQELALEEVERQVSQYRRLADDIPIFYTVDSNKSVDSIVKEISKEYVKRISEPAMISGEKQA